MVHTVRMDVGEGMVVLMHGQAGYVREIQQVLQGASIRSRTGPIPGSG